MNTFWCERAWLDDRVVDAARISVEDGTISAIEQDAPSGQRRDHQLAGLVLPGLANVHSHAFHRALRGRTHADARHGGSFWTWRQQMYRLAARLDQDSYYALARAVYGEMMMAGFTAVGEFHYLHHQPGGQPYADPNAMSSALQAAAAEAGIRLTLLDTCYLQGGLDQDGYRGLDEVQLRFSDGTGEGWLARHHQLLAAASDGVVIGAALHSVRAVPPAAVATVLPELAGQPLHLHLSEQAGENAACQAHHGQSPTGLLQSLGALGPDTVAVHATNLSVDDIAALGDSGTGVCLCPTTERDLADGIGPGRALARAGSPISLGTDSHAVIDPFEEVRGVEMHERLSSLVRAVFSPVELTTMLATTGHAALGRSGGRIAVGEPADLVAVRTDSVRTVGSHPAQLIMAATAADVSDVIVGGIQQVTSGQHQIGDVAALLGTALAAIEKPRAPSKPDKQDDHD